MRSLLVAGLIITSSNLCLAQDNLIANPGFEELMPDGWPEGWARYNWGTAGTDGRQELDTTVARSGDNSLAGINGSGSAQAGVYTHVALEEGTWALSFWAKASPGETGLVRCYLATAYSRLYEVSDEWIRLEFLNRLEAPADRVEINVQNCSGTPSTIWFDDARLERAPDRVYEIVDDARPLAEQPKLLYFDAHLMSWADNAKEWRERGFRGAFVGRIFADIHDDPWAADGDAATRGEDDELLQECRAANEKCRLAGVDSNVLKVAFYRDLPDPFDDEGCATLTTNFREAARYARLAGFPAIAIDTEYTSYQFDPDWEGYDLEAHSVAELAARLRERWREIVRGMVREYPDVDLMVLPEGAVYYGPLWSHLFAGIVEALAEAQHPGGIHLFCEGSYTSRDPHALADFVVGVRETTTRSLSPAARDYWTSHGDVALGVWPLGYYRAITDADGKFVGWSGREEVFGDEIVGSYADKSEKYPLPEFRAQFAAARTLSRKYVWVYGHGSAWWQFTPEMEAKYKAESRQFFPGEAYLLPTVPNIAEYYDAAAARETVTGLE